MDKEKVDKINNSPYKAFVAISGGGQSFIGDFCKISGASKTIVGCIIPYDRTIFDNFTGVKLTEYSSILAARKLALASYQQCIIAGVDSKLSIGIGAASSIAFDGERVGRIHKVNIAIHTNDFTTSLKITIPYGVMKREEEDKYISDRILYSLDKVIDSKNGTDYILDYEFDDNRGMTGKLEIAHADKLYSLVTKQSDYYTSVGSLENFNKIVLFGGSFNPWHTGHQQIKELSEKILSAPVILELSIKNADKGTLDFIDIKNRLDSIDGNHYIITTASLVIDKVNIIKKHNPTCEITFVMGADTFIRVFDDKYGVPVDELDFFFTRNNVKFLVFGRNGLKLDDKYSHLMIKSDEAENFNMPVSSTELRSKNEN